MANDRGNCVSCGTELTCIDDDPNRSCGSTCARCTAEDGHDYTAEPYAVFSRSGARLADAHPPASSGTAEANPEDGDRDHLKTLFAAAQQHADDTGDADMQVGDLEEVIRASWRIMTGAQRKMLLASPEVTDLLSHVSGDEPEDD